MTGIVPKCLLNTYDTDTSYIGQYTRYTWTRAYISSFQDEHEAMFLTRCRCHFRPHFRGCLAVVHNPPILDVSILFIIVHRLVLIVIVPQHRGVHDFQSLLQPLRTGLSVARQRVAT